MRICLGCKDSSEHEGWPLFKKKMEDGSAGCGKPPFDDIKGFGCYDPLGKQFGDTEATLDNKQSLRNGNLIN